MCSAADMSPEKVILFRLPIAKIIAQIYRNFIGQHKQKLILKQPSEAGKHQYPCFMGSAPQKDFKTLPKLEAWHEHQLPCMLELLSTFESQLTCEHLQMGLDGQH